MANQKTTMSEESKNDVVERSRALLIKTAPQGKITNGADAYLFDMQAPRLLSALCNEVERLQGERDGLDAAVTVQAESIETFQSQFRVMKEVIERTITFMRRWFGEHSSRKLPGDEELMTLLEAAITPKGSQK